MVENKIANKNRDEELAKLIKKAQNQPGIEDLMIVMGQYEEYQRLSAEYLQLIKPELEIHSDYKTSNE